MNDSGGGSGSRMASSSSPVRLTGSATACRAPGPGTGSELYSPRSARSSAAENERRPPARASMADTPDTRSGAWTRGTASAPSTRWMPFTPPMGPRDLRPWLIADLSWRAPGAPRHCGDCVDTTSFVQDTSSSRRSSSRALSLAESLSVFCSHSTASTAWAGGR